MKAAKPHHEPSGKKAIRKARRRNAVLNAERDVVMTLTHAGVLPVLADQIAAKIFEPVKEAL